MNAREFMKQLDKIGWFEEVPAQRSRVLSAFKAHKNFYALAVTWFDTECIEGTGPGRPSYYSKIVEIAESSYGLFAPTAIHDELDWKKEIAHISFEQNGKRFSCDLTLHHDYFNEELLGVINKAIHAGGKMSEFISLPTTDQTLPLALAPPEAYRKAVGLGLIPKMSDLMEEDDF